MKWVIFFSLIWKNNSKTKSLLGKFRKKMTFSFFFLNWAFFKLFIFVMFQETYANFQTRRSQTNLDNNLECEQIDEEEE